MAPAEMRSVLDRVRRLRAKPTSELDRVVVAIPPPTSGKPFDQGHRLGIWLRERLGNTTDRIEPEDVLRSWRIEVKDLELKTKAVDAICCWGPRHGPVIFVNGNGKHAGRSHGRRSTLAHEICHLIVDRRKGLPLAEVLGGRVAKPIEARARAFAAEFLLPREIAVSALRDSASTPAAVKRLCARFGVSPEIVAWQVRNAEASLTPEQAAYLQALVSEPWRF